MSEFDGAEPVTDQTEIARDQVIVFSLGMRERLKDPLHAALHQLGPRIPGLDVGDCHCNLLAEVALDALMPLLGAEVASARTEGIREGRQVASDAILAHADRHAPKDGNETQLRLRRHLHIAARVALPAITVEEAAAALASLTPPDTEETARD